MATDPPVQFRDEPDTSTPLNAATLNAAFHGAYVNAVEAEAAAADAWEAAEAAAAVTDDQVATLLGDDESATRAGVSALVDASATAQAPYTSSAAQTFLQKIAAGTQDVHVVMLGDSIDIGLHQWWATLMGTLAQQWPTHTFRYRYWDDPTQAWSSEYVLSTGTGPRTVWCHNGAVGGKSTAYPLGDRLTPMVGAIQPDLVMIGYLANEPDDTAARARQFRDRYAAVTESVLTVAPQAGIIACGKPGKPATPGAIEVRSAALRELVRVKGFGYIDFYAAFVAADPAWATTLIDPDEVHPTPAGQAVMATEALRHFTYHRGAQIPAQAPSSLAEPVQNLLVNGTFADWTGAFPAGWLDLYTPSPRSTASKDTTRYETGSWGMKVVPTSPSLPQATVYQAVDVRRLRGQWVTLTARARVDPAAANHPAVGRTCLYVDGASAEARPSSPLADGGDGFHWVVNSIRIPTDATTLQCWLGTGDATGAIGASEVTWDRAVLALGILPRDAIG